MNQKDITEGLEQMEAGAINPKQAAQKTAAGSKVAAQAMGAKGSSGAMMQKGLDKLASGGAMSGQLSQQIAPFAKQLSTILGDQALRQKFMMLVKQAKKTAPAAAPAPAAPQAPAGVAPAKENTNEGLAELAGVAERDHEVQMARADLYKIAKYAIKLHDMLKSTSEAEGIEGWQQSKITKAADYMGSVFHAMDYDSKFEDMPVEEGKSPHAKGTKKYKKHMAAMHAEGEMAEGPFKGIGKQLMKRKLNKQYKKSDLANFDKSGIDTDGKSPEEIGDMKSDYYHSNMDKAARAKKAKARLSREEMELEAAFEETMGQFSDTVCEDCGNPNWSNVSEEKKKGSHGKVCWKGYRRGKGNSCHKMGEDSNTMNPDAVQAWYSKYESKRSYDAYDLATGFFKYYLDSGIPTDAMEKGECAALIKKFGEDEFMDDPFGAMEKAPELAPISNALHAEFAKIVGKEAPDEEDVEQAANMVDNTDEGNAYAHAVKKAKMNGKKKGDKVDGPDGDEITLEKDQKTPLGEFILSYFDRDNGVFPKGETAVLTMVEKDYGEQFIDPAKAFIEQITAKFDEYQMRTQPQQMEAGGNCQSCSGTGSPIGTNSERCPDCNGTGSVEQKDEEFDRMRELAGLR